MTTAAALIIGDEILTGKIADQNSVVLARMLFERGVRFKRIETVPDEIDDIAQSLLTLSRNFDVVFTSGGIGPTHDDKTYEAVAKAFGLELAYHEPTLDKLRAHMAKAYPDRPINGARKKMALLPNPCEPIFLGELWVPAILVKNVYVLPGVPRLFEYMVSGIKDRFVGPVMERVILYTQKSEGDIAEALEQMQNKHEGKIAIGSYPHYGMSSYQVMVSIEGLDSKLVKESAHQLAQAIDGFEQPKEDAPTSV